MTRAILIAVLACFVVITAATNFGYNYTAKANLSETNAPINVSDLLADNGSANSTDGECICKKNTGTMSLVCGVTLAVLDEETFIIFKPRARTKRLSHEINTDLDLVWKVKRPPRSDRSVEGFVA